MSPLVVVGSTSFDNTLGVIAKSQLGRADCGVL